MRVPASDVRDRRQQDDDCQSDELAERRRPLLRPFRPLRVILVAVFVGPVWCRWRSGSLSREVLLLVPAQKGQVVAVIKHAHGVVPPVKIVFLIKF